MNRSAVPTANEGLTDEELDRNWKPSGRRPQSCVQPSAKGLQMSQTKRRLL